MLIFSLALIFVSLLIMMYEDYRYRAISIKFLAPFFLGSLLFGSLQNHLSDWLFNSLLNVLLLAFLLFVMQAYFKLRFKADGWFVDKLMGKGDLLFFLALGFVFSPLNFLITLSFLSLLSILLSLPKVITKGVKHRLPLISYMGFGLIVEFVIVYRYEFELGNDSKLMFLLLNG